MGLPIVVFWHCDFRTDYGQSVIAGCSRRYEKLDTCCSLTLRNLNKGNKKRIFLHLLVDY